MSLVLSSTIRCILMLSLPPKSTLFPSTTLFRSGGGHSLLRRRARVGRGGGHCLHEQPGPGLRLGSGGGRSEEHTSELQSRGHLVCRLLLEKKKTVSRILINLILVACSTVVTIIK